jgi:mannose-1-phosphate guanylyltransferase
MTCSQHIWALVLAGGEGKRLRALTTEHCGTAVPKQFCSLRGEHSLIEEAVHRAGRVVDAQRICTVVSQQHRQWWSKIAGLNRLPRENVIVQPRGRGTAIGILFSVLHIQARDPDALVVLLPADHHVRHEGVLSQSLTKAVLRLQRCTDRPVLLGLEPEEVDTQLGYILPGARDPFGGQEVLRFIEKPNFSIANEIIRQGGLWNAFIIAAAAHRLVDLFLPRFAALVTEVQATVAEGLSDASRAGTRPALVDLYERLPDLDFSRDLLERQASSLCVVRVPPCGWSDLGTPLRVAETLRHLRPSDYVAAVSYRSAYVNLAARHERLQRQA